MDYNILSSNEIDIPDIQELSDIADRIRKLGRWMICIVTFLKIEERLLDD